MSSKRAWRAMPWSGAGDACETNYRWSIKGWSLLPQRCRAVCLRRGGRIYWQDRHGVDPMSLAVRIGAVSLGIDAFRHERIHRRPAIVPATGVAARFFCVRAAVPTWCLQPLRLRQYLLQRQLHKGGASPSHCAAGPGLSGSCWPQPTTPCARVAPD